MQTAARECAAFCFLGRLSLSEIEGLLEEHRPRALIYACGLCGHNLGYAEDLIQEASLKAWRGWPPPDGLPHGFWRWYECIMRNCWRNMLKSRSESPWIPRLPRKRDDIPYFQSLDALIESGFDEADPAQHPLGVALLQEGADEMASLVESLPPRQSQCVKLRYLDGLKAREVADAMGISVGNVGSYLKLGLSSLRASLGGSNGS